MTQPDANTLLVAFFGFAGWAWAAFRRWQIEQKIKGFRNWQFRAMWEEYAEKHNIPINGRED